MAINYRSISQFYQDFARLGDFKNDTVGSDQPISISLRMIGYNSVTFMHNDHHILVNHNVTISTGVKMLIIRRSDKNIVIYELRILYNDNSP